MPEEEMIFDQSRKYMISKDRHNKYILFKKTETEYCPVGEIYDLSEVAHLFMIINGDFDLTYTDMIPSLDDMIHEHVSYVLKRTKNNINRTALILKIGRSTLYRWISKWNLYRR